MGKIYKCEDCKKEFKQKGHYERHKENKNPCIFKNKSISEMITEEVKKEVSKILDNKLDEVSYNEDSIKEDNIKEDNIKENKKKKGMKKEGEVDNTYLKRDEKKIIIEIEDEENKMKSERKEKIIKAIDRAHDYLYNSENIEGEDALNDIMNLLFIKCIQPIISEEEEEGKIDLMNKKYYKNLYDEKELDEIFSYFMDLKELACQPLDAIRKMSDSMDIIRQMGEILKTHPITGQIFTENNILKAKKAPTIQGLLNNVIIPLKIDDIDDNEDVIGEIYEHIINGYVKKGSKLGQFFTPRKLMRLIFKYKMERIKKIIKNIDEREKIKFYDSCMGTGGWLVSGYNIFKKKYGGRILLSGGEVKTTTFQYGLMNLIITLKNFPHDVKCESSLTHINRNRHHFILTNPPFQTDKKFEQIRQNFISDEYTKKNKIKIDEVYKLKDNSPPVQFLELDKYKLEENGLCMIILPYGDLFFGATNKEARRHFMEETNITDIILFPNGIFTHAGVKSCALIFENDKKGTKQINFIRANKECNSLTKMMTITREDIEKEPNNSWYHQDYLIDDYIEELSKKMRSYEWVEFEKVFKLEKGKIQSSKVEEDENGIKFITGAKDDNLKKITKKEISYAVGENIFISPNGNGNKRPVKYYVGECNYSDLMALMILKDEYKDRINKKYVYYYLKSIQEHIEETYQKGACNLALDQKNLNRMKIPIPNIKIQNKLINKLDSSNDKVKYMRLIVESMREDIKTFYEWTIEIENKKDETEWVEFEKVFKLKKGKIQSSKVEEDENGIKFITGAKDENLKKITKKEISYAVGENIFISPNGNGDKRPVKYYVGECNYSDLMALMILKDEYKDRINKKYIYYFLKYIQEHIEETYQKGACNLSLDIKNLDRMKIQIPIINQQNKCIDKINEMEETIKRWNKDIENILINGSNKFLEFLESESIKYVDNP